MFAQIFSKDYFNINFPKEYLTSRVSYQNYVCDSCFLMQGIRATNHISVHTVRLYSNSTSIIVHNFRIRKKCVRYGSIVRPSCFEMVGGYDMSKMSPYSLSLYLFPLFLSV